MHEVIRGKETEKLLNILVNRVDMGEQLRAKGIHLPPERMNLVMPERWMTIGEILENLLNTLTKEE